MRRLALHVLGLCLAVCTTVGSAAAQSVPPDEIATCVCLRRAVDALGAEMTAKQQGLADLRSELERATTELEATRSRMDVNDPQAGAHFREMLAHRDALFRRASGDAVTDAGSAVERYNRSSEEYNSRCANRPMNPGLLERAQANLACPAP
jgi:hypothetical protein